VGGIVTIDELVSLTTLAGFDSLETLSLLIITYNEALKQCEADNFLADLQANHGYTGSASFLENNGLGSCL
jgi:hypothetical protein